MKKYIVVLIGIMFLASCGKKEEAQTQKQATASNVELLGAGATFPYPFYSKMFDEYYKINNIKVNYQAIGSGGGIRQMFDKTVDFGASDAFMSDQELSQAGATIVHFPMCLGAVCITYNLPGNPKLKLTGELIADIFSGKIKKWNDKRISSINPGVNLPSVNMTVVHRSDGSGTTFIFSDFLTKVSPEWAKNIGTGKSLNWPAGLGGKGNPGVAGLVKQTPGAVGYVELIYSKSNNMPVADVQNKSGNFIEPTIESTSLSANVVLPPDTRVSLTNTDAAQGYPISSFTWVILYKELNYKGKSLDQAKQIVNLVHWMFTKGQKYAEPLFYAPLPQAAVDRNDANLKTITYNGKPIL